MTIMVLAAGVCVAQEEDLSDDFLKGKGDFETWNSFSRTAPNAKQYFQAAVKGWQLTYTDDSKNTVLIPNSLLMFHGASGVLMRTPKGEGFESDYALRLKGAFYACAIPADDGDVFVVKFMVKADKKADVWFVPATYSAAGHSGKFVVDKVEGRPAGTDKWAQVTLHVKVLGAQIKRTLWRLETRNKEVAIVDNLSIQKVTKE